MCSVPCYVECPLEDRADFCSWPCGDAIRQQEKAKLRCLREKLVGYIQKVQAMKNENCVQTDSSCFVEHIEKLETEIREIYEKELERIKERHRLEKEQSSEVEFCLQKRCSTLQSKCDEYENTMEKYMKKITSLETRCAKLDAQNKEHVQFKRRFEKCNMGARTVEQNKYQMFTCQDDFEIRMRQYKCMVESRYRKNLSELQIEIEKLSKEKTEITEKVRRLTSINEDYEGKITCLKFQMKELQEKIAEYSEELRKERMEKCLLKAEMGKKEELISSLRIEIRKLECDYAKLEQAAKRQREELEKEIKILERKAEELQRIVIKKSSEIRICLDEPHLPEIEALKRLLAEEDARYVGYFLTP
ncbi:uncharacterized protein [Ptychodera flava]|uniref:uncharacterized protein n=1 Tax=Ptychodera flava TaxID=63121 RepID=UPI00396A00C4